MNLLSFVLSLKIPEYFVYEILTWSKLCLFSVISTAIQNGEYDFDGTKDDTPAVPILLRAEQVGHHLNIGICDTRRLKTVIDA